MMRFTATLIAVAALCGSVVATDNRENVCLGLIQTHCSGQASPSIMNTCVERGILTCSMPPHCLQPSETGMCRAAFPRFFYNAGSGSCEEFIYGGCGGNTNNFETKKECHDACSGMRFCGGNTGATCPENYHCAEQPGETGMCVLVPQEKRAAARQGGGPQQHGHTMADKKKLKKKHPEHPAKPVKALRKQKNP
ncbi:Trophoblast Kunitz domain protein 1 [Seminavis robusta]|uniref:Trophoblast Kunitz domain protein 1 n=1 Tax=Seminavis robusta TaxID=568900 RepID=A0A9N8H1W7_9STRA|nr:Trophoblast Kunitz domain protein 1 [Seminavis robusta]|eukprot:Sro1_g000240.1 Trophoblast Kunitz domain protein 1 (194) ;mRNA; r:76209-76790